MLRRARSREPLRQSECGSRGRAAVAAALVAGIHAERLQPGAQRFQLSDGKGSGFGEKRIQLARFSLSHSTLILSLLRHLA